NDIAPPVAIIAFDGMQSHRWAAPPTTSRSTIVTSAPRRAACVAAVLPAGPPPMITKRMAMRPGYAAAPSQPSPVLVYATQTGPRSTARNAVAWAPLPGTANVDPGNSRAQALAPRSCGPTALVTNHVPPDTQ